MSKFAALYARSSKDRHDVSISSQVAELKARAASDGYMVIAEYNDTAISGKDDDRPAFQDMVAAAEAGECEWSRLYVYDTARFSRSVLDSATYEHLLDSKGIEIVYLQIPDGADQATRELITQVFRGINRWHSVKSKTDSLRGMRENIKRGYRAGGRAPYGYRLHHDDTGAVREGKPVLKSKLAIKPEAAEVVAEYFKRRAMGEGRKAIAADFTRRGIPSPRNGKWSHTTLRSFENNIRVYCGDTVFGRNGERSGNAYVGDRWTAEDCWTTNKGTHEAIISEDLAARVLAQRVKRQRVASKPSNYLLTGTMFCTQCGAGYVGDAGYYGCSARLRWGRDHCTNGRVRQDAIERAVQQAIRDVVIQPAFVSDYLRAAKRHLRRDGDGAKRTSGIVQRLAKTDQSIQRWVQSFESDGPGAQTAVERIRALEAEKEVLTAELAEAQAEGKVVPLSGVVSDDFLRELLERFDEVMSLGDIADRKALLAHVATKIEIGERFEGSMARPLVLHATIRGDKVGVPDGIRTRVAGVKGRCPGPD